MFNSDEGAGSFSFLYRYDAWMPNTIQFTINEESEYSLKGFYGITEVLDAGAQAGRSWSELETVYIGLTIRGPQIADEQYVLLRADIEDSNQPGVSESFTCTVKYDASWT